MSKYQDWKKDNPNKSINDFYSEFPLATRNSANQLNVQNQHNILSQPHHNQNFIPVQTIYVQPAQAEKTVDTVNLLVSIAAILSVTLPWVDAKYLSVSVVKLSGFDLHEMVKFMSAFNRMDTNPYLVNSFYLIPGGALLSLIGELVKKEIIISFGQISNIFALGFWSYLFWVSSKEYTSLYDMLGFGYYLAVICAIIYLFKLFTD